MADIALDRAAGPPPPPAEQQHKRSSHQIFDHLIKYFKQQQDHFIKYFWSIDIAQEPSFLQYGKVLEVIIVSVCVFL